MERVAKMLTERDARWRRERDELMAMAAEPVQPDSGWHEYGDGDHLCVSMNFQDGSTRVLRFRNVRDAEQAQALASKSNGGLLGPAR